MHAVKVLRTPGQTVWRRVPLGLAVRMNGIALAPMSKLKEAPPVAGRCPECGAALVRESGCTLCRACGHAECG